MFIPRKRLRSMCIGDRVKSKEIIETRDGTFTKGHEFTVKSGLRGAFDLVDSDGNTVWCTPHMMQKFEILR